MVKNTQLDIIKKQEGLGDKIRTGIGESWRW
jgi:hypothetical protein